jgi:thiol:disulfide interchange protein DsbC
MRTKLVTPFLIATTGLLLPGALPAAEKKVDLAKIEATLETRYPQVGVIDVNPAPLKGLYEVFTGDGIFYTNDTGDYLLGGPLVETSTRRNLTAERLDERNSIDFSVLPLDKAIKTVKGDGSRTIAVFSDPDCPFCKQLEKELVSVENVTIYTFLYPLDDLHPDAPAKARAIWCSADRSQSWAQWMNDGKLGTATPDCASDPLTDVKTLGRKLRVVSTPTSFFPNGHRMGGAAPAADIERALAANSQPKPESAAK